ncbi:hypothetical protein D3C72_2293600 [compost metagenome]
MRGQGHRGIADHGIGGVRHQRLQPPGAVRWRLAVALAPARQALVAQHARNGIAVLLAQPVGKSGDW